MSLVTGALVKGALLVGALVAEPTMAQHHSVNSGHMMAVSATPRQSSISASKAAQIARKHTGGKVLKISPSGGGQRVKVLLPSGKVTYVFVNAKGEVQ
ncbi:hypothetical protein GCM10007877_26240 [Marinibactrum halimedae]|uniref:PepSY domain-containing protein n=2 Tax=Marinibactrum halimedae TaxID=1444977 RepID=A0AA37TB91_9GAMM|nr:hypothetical protein GCM10007877_26240 [Marinibactrum halimedae]